MMCRIDKRLIEILEEMGVSGLSYDLFKRAYAVRKEERDNCPKLAAQRRFNQQINEMMFK